MISSKNERNSKVKEARVKKGWTQDYLGGITGYSREYINKLERGKIKNPSVAAAKSISYALGISVFEV